MATRNQPKTVYRWLENSVGADVLRRHIPRHRWLFLRYEDFAVRPRHTVQRILSLLNEGAAAPFADDHTVVLAPHHTLSGNPDRFKSGAVRIRPDDEWRRLMPGWDLSLVTAATLPYLLRHRYPVAARRGDHRR
jgi:hypothetical protein